MDIKIGDIIYYRCECKGCGGVATRGIIERIEKEKGIKYWARCNGHKELFIVEEDRISGHIKKGGEMSDPKKIFDLAAKVGCLEGYLYPKDRVDTSYLPNWVDNINNMFIKLSENDKKTFKEEYERILKNIFSYCKEILAEDDPIVIKLKNMLDNICPY
jgi:hypothetical protein